MSRCVKCCGNAPACVRHEARMESVQWRDRGHRGCTCAPAVELKGVMTWFFVLFYYVPLGAIIVSL